MTMRSPSFHPVLLSAAAAFATLANVLNAADLAKADNATALNLAGSWAGGAVPGSNDVAVWNNTVTANRSTALGANLDFKGIRIENPGGTLMTISGANTLTLGSSGIDMSAATVDLTISSILNVSTDQTWSVGSGRVLTISNANTGASGTVLSLTGPGSVSINTSGAAFGSTTLQLGGGVRLLANTASRTIANNILLNGDIGVGSTTAAAVLTFTGTVDVGSAVRAISLRSSSTDGTTSALTFNGASAVTGSGKLQLINGNASGTVRSIIGGSASTVSITSDFEIGQNVVVTMSQANAFTNSSDLTVDGRLRLGNLSGSPAAQTVKSLSGTGAIDPGLGVGSSSVSSLTIDGGVDTSTTTFSGVIENGAGGRVSITKSGNTTQIFAGSNSYTGQTQIIAGTLLITGTHTETSAVTGNGYNSAATGHFQVGSGATFGGSGRIAGNNAQNNSNMILVGSGGVLAPGNGIGRLTLDGANIGGTGSRVLNMATGADFNLELAGNGGSADQVAFWNYAGGDLLLNSNEINLTLNGALVAGTYTVSIFAFYSDSGTTLMSSGITSGLTLGVVGAGITGASINYNAGGNTIDLTYTVIPEPSTIALMGLGLTFVLWRRPKRAASLV
jgi:autotransporter-associated beta strand protein